MASRTFLIGIVIFTVTVLSGIHPMDKSIITNIRSANQLLADGNPEMALLKYQQILQEDPSRIDLIQKMGKAAFMAGKVDIAREYLTLAERLVEIDEDGLLTLGDVYFQLGDQSRAVESWKKVQMIPENAADVSKRLIKWHIANDQLSYARDNVNNWLALDPDNPDAKEMLAWLTLLSDPPDSEIFFTEINKNGAEYGDILTLISSTREISESTFESSSWWVKVGDSAKIHGFPDISMMAYDRSLKIKPDNPTAWIKLGLVKQSMYLDSELEITNAVNFSGNDVEVMNLIADYWYINKQPEISLLYLHKAINIAPSIPASYSRLGTILADMGRINEGLRSIKQAALLSKSAEGWNNVTRFCLNYGVYVREEGLPAARKAQLLSPDSSETLELSGQVFSFLEDSITAEKYYKQAIEIDDLNYSAHLHLGYLYFSQGKPDLAVHHLTIAAFQNIDLPVSEQAKTALKNPER